MTLEKQILSAISALFVIVLIGVEAIYLHSARAHLQDQLESHAQDAATSIGLSLGILMRQGDPAIAETVINAAFDRGQYERIELFISPDTQPAVARRMPDESPASHPAWFSAILPLTGPTAESLVTTGWRQLGRVRVTSHPRFAYAQLWDTARITTLWLLLIYLVAVAVVHRFLRGVLRPLKAVEAAAEAIGRREFVTVHDRPRAPELARVITAMNSLSRKVREALEAETRRAARLQDAASVDPISGVLNRDGFTTRFNSHFRDEVQAFSGVLALVQILGMTEINARHGTRRGDDLVKALAGGLGKSAGRDGIVGRQGGAAFAVVIPDENTGNHRSALTELQRAGETAIAELGLAGGATAIAIGAVSVAAGRPVLADLIEGADRALRQAIERGSELPELLVLDESTGTPAADLLDVVRDAIGSARIDLAGQRVLSSTGAAVLHTEIMGRLMTAQGRPLTATEFMPLVSRYELAPGLDQAIIGRVLAGMSRRSDEDLAINVAPRSVRDPAFSTWLAEMLRKSPLFAARLVFELSEHGILQDEGAAGRFAGEIRRAGARFAIDHFGVHRDSLGLMQRLMPAYVKLSSVHTPRIAADVSSRFFVEAVVRAGAQLDIPVIGQNLEDQATVQSLTVLGVAGYQGYIAGRPAPWP